MFHRVRNFRFSLKSLLVLMVGIAIGFSLNLHTLQLLTGRPAYPTSLPPYVIEAPDILKIDLLAKTNDASDTITGQHLVGPDGRINLGEFGNVYVSGHTIAEAQDAIRKHLSRYLQDPQITVDVFAYNSKNYYVITEGANSTDEVQMFPITGNETVLDAIANLPTVPPRATSTIFIARPAANGVGPEQILAVQWQQICGGSSATNYALFPRDRLIISQK
jgi:protein involved in polysaccharide export with SLBB domain